MTPPKISIVGLIFSFLFSLTLISCSDNSTTSELKDEVPCTPKNAAPTQSRPIILGYFPSWSESSVGTNQGTRFRDIPRHVNHVFLAFAKPNLRYVKGSFDLTHTGIETPYNGTTLKESVDILKGKGTKVILSIGGATYWDSSDAYDIDYQQIKDLVDDMGFAGIDWDFEPDGTFTTIGELDNVNRFIEFFTKSRAIMPKGQYLLACAPAGAGALGGSINDDPNSPFAYDNRNELTNETDDNLHNSTAPHQAISLFGFAFSGHMIPVFEAVGDQIDLVAYQGYNTGAATDRTIMYDSYRHYANQHGFSVVAGIHFPEEPWGPHYTYSYENVSTLSAHISSSQSTDGIMIWQLLLADQNSSAYDYLYIASQVLNGVDKDTAIENAENYSRDCQ